jgi:hypothetical protein
MTQLVKSFLNQCLHSIYYKCISSDKKRGKMHHFSVEFKYTDRDTEKSDDDEKEG